MSRIAFVIYRGLTWLFGTTPLRFNFALGWVLGEMAHWAIPPYRNLVRRNLRIAFAGEKTEPELRSIAREHFRLVGANLLAGARIVTMPREELVKLVTIEGKENLEKILAGGRGGVAAINHIGNWELFATIPCWFPDARFGTVYQRLGNPLIDADVRAVRRRLGVETFDRKDGLGRAGDVVKAGGILAILIDQHAGNGGIWAPFFGKLASTSPLAATLASRLRAPVIPAAMYTDGFARWRLVVGPPIETTRADIATTTANLNVVLEKQVRRAPSDWFWVHNRWKAPSPRFLFDHYKRGVALPDGFPPESLKPFELLVRSSNWLGDAVMSIPAVKALKRGRPDTRITVLAKSKLADLWRRVPEVDAVAEIAPGDSVFRVARNISGRFEAAVLFPNSFRVALEVWLARIPRRTGRPGHYRRMLLDQVYRKKPKKGPPRHQVHDYLDLAETVGAVIDRPQAIRFPTRQPRVGSPKLVGICAGAEYGPAKRWPPESFIETAKIVSAQTECRWVLFGTRGDRPISGQIASGIGETSTDLAGQTSLAELIDRLSGCDALLANDTGTMHLASYLGVPTVAIFGSTEQRMTGPLGERHQVLRAHSHCSPCFLRACPFDLRCMRDIGPARAADALLLALGSRPHRG